MCTPDIFLGLIAILFPPIAVWVKRGLCSADSLINIALCCLGYLPGLLHAWYIIAASPDFEYEAIRDGERGEGGTVTYYYVQGNVPARNYGTTGRAPAAPKTTPSPAQQPHASGSAEVPPSYSEAVQGDHKVQGP